MISLPSIFIFLILIFALIGAFRGWAKEILVTFTVILSIFLFQISIMYIKPIAKYYQTPISTTTFWVTTILFLLIVLFGYQTPVVSRLIGKKLVRESFIAGFLGFFLGALNGYLILGMIWYFLSLANYNLPGVQPPPPDTILLKYLPPDLFFFKPPFLYFFVALSFLCVIVVFI